MQDVKAHLRQLGRQARDAARVLARADAAAKNRALAGMAAAIRKQSREILAANAADVAHAGSEGRDAAFVDRLSLTPKLVEQMAQGVEQVAALDDPVGRISDRAMRPSGIEVARM